MLQGDEMDAGLFFLKPKTPSGSSNRPLHRAALLPAVAFQDLFCSPHLAEAARCSGVLMAGWSS